MSPFAPRKLRTFAERKATIASIVRRTFDPAIIERERPQVVIEEYVERSLWRNPPVSGLATPRMARK
jgi:hypothetical protein